MVLTHSVTEFVHRQRKREDIGLESVALSPRDLWRLVYKSPFVRHRRLQVCHTRDPVVGDLRVVPSATDENVTRLDVTVDDSDGMQIEQSRSAFLLFELANRRCQQGKCKTRAKTQARQTNLEHAQSVFASSTW